jgi:heme/copper-type cytochrome/quinol oxidase subunit 1
MAALETEAPPVGEEVHMPEPSILPILNAVGLTLAIVGITLSLAITIIGLLLFFVTLVQWIRAAAHEMSELPLDHDASH